MIRLFTLTCALFLTGTQLFAQLSGGTTYPINGTANPPTSFATIQAAATYLNTTGITGTGNVILELQTGYNPASEPASGINFDVILGATATRKVILRPATGFSTTITGSVAGGGMLNIRGTQYLTIDGRQGGTGAIGLTVTNTSTATTDSTCTIRFVYGTLGVSVAYCNIKGASKAINNGGVVLIGNGSATAGNQVTVENCNIDGTGAAHNGVCSNGSLVSNVLGNSGDTIRNCNIYDHFDNAGTSGTAGVRTQQGANNTVITGNSIYQTVSRVFTQQYLTYGILLGAGTYYTTDNAMITNNYIGGTGPLCSGTMNLSSASVVAGFSAIFMSYGNTAAVTGNTIKNITVTCNSGAGTFANSAIFSSVFYGATISISNNTIDSFMFINTNGPITVTGINVATQLDTTFVKNITPTYTITGNSIKNITATPSATGNGQIYGIRVLPTTTTSQGGNLYFNNTTVTISQNTLDGLRTSGISTSSFAHAIIANATNGGTSTHFVRLFPTITSNTIKNISSGGAIIATGFPVAGGIVIQNAHTSNATYTDTLKIRDNVIQNLYGLNAGDLSTAVGGIYANLGKVDISRNRIFNLYNAANGSSNNPYVYGVNVFGMAAIGSVDNNYISLGDTATRNSSAYGVINSGSTIAGINVYYNTILISGSSTTKNSAAIMRGDPLTFAAVTTVFTLKNNLLVNRRTGSGNNVAIGMPGTASFTSDNNSLVTGSSSAVNYYNAGALDFATWKTTTSADAYSYYAQSSGATNLSVSPATILLTDLFSSVSYSSQANLQISNSNTTSWFVSGKGIAINPYSLDNSGGTRGVTVGTPTCIGANEFVTSTSAPANVITNTIGNDTTTVTFAGRELMKVYWLSGTFPTGFTSQYFSGRIHPNYTTGDKGGSYYTFTGTGGSGYKYKAQLNYGPHETGNITNSNPTTLLSHYKTGAWTLGAAGSAITGSTPQQVITDTLAVATFPVNASTAFMLTDNVSPLFDLLPITGNTITAAQSICSGATPASLAGTIPAGGTGTYTYSWLSSTTSATTGFAVATGTTNGQNYSPAALTQSTWFRRYVVSSTVSDTSTAVKITVNTAIATNTITSSPQTVCSGSTPTAITGSTPTGGDGTTYSYSWLSSTTSATTGFAVATSIVNAQNYSPVALTQSTWYRRVVTSGVCAKDTTTAIKVTVTVAVATNTITSSPQTICISTTPTAITASVATGGDGSTYTYSWLSSTTSATAGFAVASGTTNAQGYSPAALTQNTWYRRVVTSGACANDTTTAIQITVNAAGTWTGTTSNAWNNTANWSCPAVPTSSTNVTINSGAPNMPVITDAQFANNVTIGIGATLTLNAAASQLSVSGIVTNSGTWTNSNGRISLSGSSAQTLPAGTYNKLDVNNTAGGIAGGAITLNDSLLLNNGTFTLGANNLTLGNASYTSAGTATRYIVTNAAGSVISQNIGTAGKTGNVVIPVGNATFNPVTLNNTGTADAFTIKVIDSVTLNYTGSTPTGTKLTSNAVNRTWIVNEGVAGGSNATVTVQWNTADELGGFTRASSYVSRYNGTTWLQNTASAATGSNPYTQSRTGITSFSPFGVGSAGTLPVQLLSFTGVKSGSKALLTWVTASEQNNSYFTVSRSADGKVFEPAGQVKGNGTTSVMHTYDLTDDLSALVKQHARTVYYRLTQVDESGRQHDGGMVSMTISDLKAGMAVSTQPNPFSSAVTVLISSASESAATITVVDITGRTLSTQEAAVKTGDNTVELANLEHLTDGVYFVTVTTTEGVITRKVVKRSN